jgi:hypothetical protein
MKSISVRLALHGGAIALLWFASQGFARQKFAAQTAKPVQAQTGQARATEPALTGFPFTNESLAYTVNWPGGASLGEAHLSATASPTNWRFELNLDAGVPGFAVKDTYRSTASLDLCSDSFNKDWMHGTRKGGETVTIDKAAATATRTPATGVGSSKMPVPGCVRDALTFLFYARREMGQGRVPAAQEIIFGAIYNGSFEYAGAQTIMVSNKNIVTDKLVCHVRGPASDIQFEAYFDRDAARTPVSIRVPLPLGKFSLELVR